MEETNQMPTPATAAPAPSAAGMKYAGGWIRFLAYIIDAIILGIVNYLIMVTGMSETAVSVITSVIGLAYMVCLIALKQQTVGMMALKLKVVSAKAGTVNWWAVALLREIVGRFLAGIVIGLGYLWIFFHPKKQGWHDLIAKTYVIHEQ